MAAPTYVQDSGLVLSSGTTATLSLTGVTSGNAIVILIGRVEATTARTYTTSDSAANSYGEVVSQHSSQTARFSGIHRAVGVTGGNLTISVVTNSAHAFYAVAVETTAHDAVASPVSASLDEDTNTTTHYSAPVGSIDTGADVIAFAIGVVHGTYDTATKDAAFTLIGTAASRVLAQYRASDSALTDERGSWTTTGSANKAVGCIASFAAPSGGTTISPPAIASAASLFAPVVSVGAVSLALATIASGATLHVPTATPGAVTLSPPAIASTATLQAPTVTVGAVTVALPAITSSATLAAPTLTVGSVTVSVPAIASSATLYEPVVSAGGSALALPTIATGSALFAPTVTPGSVSLALPAIASGAATSAPTVTTSGALSLPTIASDSALTAPTLTPGAVTVSLPAIASGGSTFAPTVAVTITLPTLTSGAVVSAPTLTVGAVTVALPTIATGSVLYAVTLTGGIVLDADAAHTWTVARRRDTWRVSARRDTWRIR